jgi:RNA polymerase sigma-70 factor (ECF subfamily)
MDLRTSIDKYRETVFSVAVGYVRNIHDADDISQNVFLKLFQKLKKDGSFATDESEKAWLIRVTVNESKDLLKSAWRNNTQEFSETDESLHARDSFRTSEHELYDYLQRLKPKYRTVLYMHYYEGYTTKEIANILKIPQMTVLSQLKRARDQLKKIIMEEEVYV